MNKGSFLRSRRFRYGSMSVGITALVIAAVILFNVVFSMLASKYNWYIDMTREGLYTVSDACYSLLDDTFEKVNTDRAANGEDPVKVSIKFCDMHDNLMGGVYTKYILTTALELQERYPDTIEVEYIDIYENPSAVNPYRVSVGTAIYNTSVIVVSGGEYRLYNADSFFLTNSEASTPWAYFGEKRFASAILATTQAEQPVAGILTGHGETYNGDAALVSLIEMAGYEIAIVDDLVNWEMPDNCRLLVSYNPTKDFRSTDDGISDVSEIAIMDEFLAGENHSLMVFVSPDSPPLPNLEDYLALWGIAFGRTDENQGIVVTEEPANALTDNGTTFIGQYETVGSGSSLTSDMRKQTFPQKVVFRNTMPIEIAKAYNVNYWLDEDTGAKVQYGYKSLGATGREIWSVFSSGAAARGFAAGKEVSAASPTDPYQLMTLSIQRRLTQEDDYGASYADGSSYVLACGSTDFATEPFLSSNVYGNSEVLLKAFVTMGKDSVPVSLTFIPFADLTIDTLTTERANRITILLSVIPALICFGVGVYVLVRRKYS